MKSSSNWLIRRNNFRLQINRALKQKLTAESSNSSLAVKFSQNLRTDRQPEVPLHYQIFVLERRPCLNDHYVQSRGVEKDAPVILLQDFNINVIFTERKPERFVFKKFCFAFAVGFTTANKDTHKIS